MYHSYEITKKLRKEKDMASEKAAERIRKVAIAKINSMSAAEIDMRVIGSGSAKFSPEISVKTVLVDFATLISSIDNFSANTGYVDIKQPILDVILPIFCQKVLETKIKDVSKLNIAEKRQVLIDNINKQSFNLCKDNATRDGRPLQDGIIEIDESSEFDDYYVKMGGTITKTGAGKMYLDPANKPHKPDTLDDIHPIVSDETVKIIKEKTPMIVKNDFKFTGAKTCTIRFLELKNGSVPKFKQPEQCYHHIDSRKDMKEGRYKVLLSSYPLDSQEVEALKICFRKNNRQYKLDRKVLQDVINGKINKKAPDAIALVKSSKRK